MSSIGAHRPSSFLATKGLFPEPTYRAFQHWDLAKDLEANVRQIRELNTVGGPSLGWLKDFGKVLLRRFGPKGPDPSLIELAQRGCDLSIWKPLLIWQAVRTDPLLLAFLADWLFAQQSRGVVRVTSDAAREFLRTFLSQNVEEMWSESNLEQSAGGLLRTATVAGLLTGSRVKQFAAYQLPEESFLYCLHDLMQRHHSTSRVVADATWRIFLMTQASVERDLLRMHQMHRLQFDRAGSLLELKLPCGSAAEYARRMTA